jgi:hypothetical protein
MAKHSRLAPLLLILISACTAGGELPEQRSPDAPEFVFADERDAALSAISDNPQRAAAATTHLRALGPSGLQAMFDVFGDECAYRLGEAPSADNYDRATSDRILAAVDRVAGQRDAWASRLYWYTDRDQALAVARELGRPVLNLWLLGRLDDEFC